MPSKFSLSLIDFNRASTTMSLVGPDYAADGSDKQANDTLWDNLSLSLKAITQGELTEEFIASTYDDVDNPPTPDPGAQRTQEWVFQYSVPSLNKTFITSIGTADTDDVDVISVDGLTILDPQSTDFTGLKSAWDNVVQHWDGSAYVATSLQRVIFRA